MSEAIRIYNIAEIIEILDQDENRVFRYDSERKSSYIKNAKYRSLERMIGWCDSENDRYVNDPLTISERTRGMEFIDVTPVKLSEDEKVILRNLPGKYKYIARGTCGLQVFEITPFKCDGCWEDTKEDYEYIDAFAHLFQQIQWSDKEPALISDLLEV